MNIKPCNQRVILKTPITKEVEQNGIILPSTRQEGNIQKSTVISISPDCQEVAVGDEVIFHVALKETFGDHLLDDDYILVREQDILAKIIK